MDNLFLKQIQECLRVIKENKDKDDAIHLVAEVIFSHHNLLEETSNTISLVNLIADWLENNGGSVLKIYDALYFFWLDCIIKAKINVFYFGELTNLKILAKHLNPAIVNSIRYLASNDTDIHYINDCISSIESSVAPLIIYDPDGMHFLDKIKNTNPIASLNNYEILIHNSLPTSDVLNSFTILLAHQYTKLSNTNIKTVIIGNSYGIYAFPDNIIQHSVNISMHSLGIKQTQRLVEHILIKYPHIDNFIFCIGFFDLYGDLLKSKHAFNKNVIDAFSQILSHYHIASITHSYNNILDTFSRLIIESGVDSLPQFQDMDNIALMQIIYNENLQLVTSTTSLEIEQQGLISEQRALVHSKAVNHQVSLDENKIRTSEISERIKLEGKTSYWLTPPFPDEYTKNIVSEMKQTHRVYFNRICNEDVHFIDLSEEKSFRPQDFRDGDHLNFTGACKLINLLRNNNIPV
ncbi:hypothetical protein [Phytobacter diazotrophicus]|uniref:hypothetical protein n=1 Tax=Phytobacter diazotrophicus TaxID=395631 RepID=UPI001451677E|nr:hypothetical protein [Phytobacter diazotrophicus]QJF17375.1 hypothetical protein HHA33_12860 [Phytobacter diazotrophicus]